MTFAICFDIPNEDGDLTGDPVFAGFTANGNLGVAQTLATAYLFNTEEIAQHILENSYGSTLGQFGVVVEVPA